MPLFCYTISTNDGLGTVCAGIGNPPSTVGGLNFVHGDLDFIRVKGQWYKIASEWRVKRSGWGVDFDKTGGSWKGFVLEADSWFIKYAFYGMRRKSPSTSINYINRVKREVYPWMPGI